MSTPEPPPPSPDFQRFVASVTGPDPEWRGSVDEETLHRLEKPERRAAEELLMERLPRNDWRAPGALARAECRGAVMPMKRWLPKASPKMKVAIAQALTDLEAIPNPDATVSEVLRGGDLDGGLAALTAAEGRRSLEIRNALAWSAKNHPEPDIRANAGAQLFQMAGLARDPLAWDFRPVWIRLAADDPAERELAFDELSQMTELPPEASR